MAVHIEDMKAKVVLAPAKRSATTLGSGFIDMSGSRRLFLNGIKTAFSGKNSKLVIRVGHATASGVTYASATAISVVSTTTGSIANLIGINVDWSPGYGRFARVRVSGVTASSDFGILAQAVENEKVPPTTTGFTSITYVPDNP